MTLQDTQRKFTLVVTRLNRLLKDAERRELTAHEQEERERLKDELAIIRQDLRKLLTGLPR